MAGVSTNFEGWFREWTRLAEFQGPTLSDAPGRIDGVVEHWRAPIPGSWERSLDLRLLDPSERYLRGDRHDADRRKGEHALEFEVLELPPEGRGLSCLSFKLIDGVNAVPLVKDEAGGRKSNVEADMLLLVQDEAAGAHRLLLVEAKVESDNAWYAVVELLRQLRLVLEPIELSRLFRERKPQLDLPTPLPVTGVVLAPTAFYDQNGKKANSVAPAEDLIHRMRDEFDIDVRLAVWRPPQMTER